MKNNVLKYYMVAIYLLSSFVLFAQSPGNNDDNGNLEGGDAPVAPIDDSVWVLGLLGLLFVFFKIRAINKQACSQE